MQYNPYENEDERAQELAGKGMHSPSMINPYPMYYDNSRLQNISFPSYASENSTYQKPIRLTKVKVRGDFDNMNNETLRLDASVEQAEKTNMQIQTQHNEFEKCCNINCLKFCCRTCFLLCKCLIHHGLCRFLCEIIFKGILRH